MNAPALKTTSLEIPCTFEGISEHEPDVERLVQQLIKDDDQVYLISLSVVEVLCNIVEHGFKGHAAPGECILVSMQASATHLDITVVDKAAPPPARTIEHLTSQHNAMPSLEQPVADLPESGWGLNIIAHTASSIDYERTADSNVLTLCFNTPH